eukprot:1184916-Prorocentrum_minimum.AAC.2
MRGYLLADGANRVRRGGREYRYRPRPRDLGLLRFEGGGEAPCLPPLCLARQGFRVFRVAEAHLVYLGRVALPPPARLLPLLRLGQLAALKCRAQLRVVPLDRLHQRLLAHPLHVKRLLNRVYLGQTTGGNRGAVGVSWGAPLYSRVSVGERKGCRVVPACLDSIRSLPTLVISGDPRCRAPCVSRTGRGTEGYRQTPGHSYPTSL